MWGRVVAEVGADIANAQTSTTCFQIFRMLISRFMQCINLWNKQWYKTSCTLGEESLHCSSSTDCIKLSASNYKSFLTPCLHHCKRPIHHQHIYLFTPCTFAHPLPSPLSLQALPSPATFHPPKIWIKGLLALIIACTLSRQRFPWRSAIALRKPWESGYSMLWCGCTEGKRFFSSWSATMLTSFFIRSS